MCQDSMSTGCTTCAVNAYHFGYTAQLLHFMALYCMALPGTTLHGTAWHYTAWQKGQGPTRVPTVSCEQVAFCSLVLSIIQLYKVHTANKIVDISDMSPMVCLQVDIAVEKCIGTVCSRALIYSLCHILQHDLRTIGSSSRFGV